MVGCCMCLVLCLSGTTFACYYMGCLGLLVVVFSCVGLLLLGWVCFACSCLFHGGFCLGCCFG